MYLGIKISGKVLLVLGLIEIAAVLALSLWGIFDPGPGGLNLQPYNISHAPSANAFYLAVVFSIFGISGWEAAAPVAEETREPRKTVPKALVLAVVLMMLFFTVCSYGLMIGWGTNHVGTLVSSSTLPALVLGHQFWGSGWIIILLVLLNSTVAVSIACGNAATRALFGMARSGSLPKTFSYIHPRTKTPIHSVTALMVITAVYGLGVSIWIGADNIWYQEGLIFVPLLAFVYIMGNIGTMRMYLTTHRDQFNVFLHVVIPVVVSLAFIWVTYKTLYPAPASPLKWGPYIALGWGLIGCAILVYLRIRGSEEWLLNATETAEEIAAGGIEKYAAEQAGDQPGGSV
jgi:amino acid transporter